VKIEIKNNCIVSDISREQSLEIQNRLTLDNPKYIDAIKQGYRPFTLPATLSFYTDLSDDGQTLEVPGGFICELKKIQKKNGSDPVIIDKRPFIDPVAFQFHGKLRPSQARACEGLIHAEFGVLHAPTGSGKTAMALWLVARRSQPALVVVHTRELLDQWVKSASIFLGIPRKEVGVIGSGKFEIGEKITIAMVQTLARRGSEINFSPGCLIMDECHRVPAMQFVKSVTRFDSRFRTGLTATPFRRDRLSEVIFWYMGEIKGKIEKKELIRTDNLCEAEVVWVKTRFYTDTDASADYARALLELTRDRDRNRLVCESAVAQSHKGICLVLSDRKKHCREIAGILDRCHGITAFVLTGSTPEKERKHIINELRRQNSGYLVATGQLVGEGFDLPGITNLVMTCPVRFSGRVIQYMGRILRPATGKKSAVIIDFVDEKMPVFAASARARFLTYKQEGVFRQVVI